MSDYAFIESTNRYSVLQRVGAGGMGVVYKVFDRERNTVLALKTMLGTDAAALYRFKREFRALAQVKHPNLVRLYELNSINERWFFTMEFVEGCGFLEYVHGGQGSPASGPDTISFPGHNELTPFPLQSSDTAQTQRAAGSRPRLDRLRESLVQLAYAMRALHDAGQLHRDIKPSNIRVTPAGRLVLLDFGLIIATNQVGGWQSTGNGIVGTPAYMSPEQALSETLTPASDWYSVGVILYQALTGVYPFQTSTEGPLGFFELLKRKNLENAPSPKEVSSDVPDDLNDLCVGLLRRDPVQRMQGREFLHMLAPDASLERGDDDAFSGCASKQFCFVGRSSQLSELREALDDVHPGRPSVVHLHGSSGMGKSTIVRQFLDDPVVQRRAIVLEGKCYEQESVPYKALDSIVDSLSHFLACVDRDALPAMLPNHLFELVRVFPVLERIESIAEAPRQENRPTDPHSRRQLAFQAFRELLQKITQKKTMIIAVDDLQWGDVDSAVILNELLRPPDAPALLFLGTYRTEDASTSSFLRQHVRAMHDLGDYFAYREICVGPLAPEEAEDLAAALLGHSPSQAFDGVARALVAEAKGHPYFLRELTHHVNEHGTPATRSPLVSIVSLTDVLKQRLLCLPAPARILLNVIAVAGHPIETRIAVQATGLENEAYPALDHLYAQGLVRSRSVDQSAFVEAFHDRIRETAVAALSAEEVRRLHADVALALEASGQADPEKLALHFEAAGERARAGAYAGAAGDAAAELLAFDWAAELYCRSRSLLGDEHERYRELTRKAGDAFANAGRGAPAAEKYLELAFACGGDESMHFRRRAAEQLLASGHIDDGLQVMRGILKAIGMAYPPTPRHALLALAARRIAVRVRGYGFRRVNENEIAPDALARLDTCRTIAEGLAMVDNIRGAHFQARNLLMSLRAGEPTRISLSLSLEAGYAATAGTPARKRAFDLAGQAARIAEETGNPQAVGRAAFAHGLSHYLVGEWRHAFEHCSKAVEIFRNRCVGATWDLTSSQRFQIGSLYYQGALREIAARVPVLLEDARRRGDLYLATDLYSRDYHLNWLALDNSTASRRSIEAAMNLWSRREFHLQHYNATMALAHCDLYDGEPEAARQRLLAIWPQLKASMLLRVQVLRTEVQFLHGRTALAVYGKTPGNTALLNLAGDAAKRIEREGSAWSVPLAGVVRAGIAWARHSPDQAIESLRSAIEGFELAEMGLHAAAARLQLGQMIEGSDGFGFVEQASQWMTSQGVQRPDAMAALFCPIPKLNTNS